MSEARKSGIPDFTCGRVAWSCWTLGDGGAAVHEWRDAGGRLRVWAETHLATDADGVERAARCWVFAIDGERRGYPQPTLRSAMEAAMAYARRAAA